MAPFGSGDRIGQLSILHAKEKQKKGETMSSVVPETPSPL
jgi:hypothetical protein